MDYLYFCSFKKLANMKFILRLIFFYSFALLLPACSSEEKADFLTIPVNFDKESPLDLSEIADKIESIELEVTDESLISRPFRIFCSSDYIIIAERNSIMLFDKKGKFIRQIGSRGQGPYEYIGIGDVAVDFDSKKIFVFSGSDHKLICYDIEGIFLTKSPPGYSGAGYNLYMSFLDNRLLFLEELFTRISDKTKRQRILYFIDDDLLKSDSIIIKSFDPSPIFQVGYNLYGDYITKERDNIYLYYYAQFPSDFVSDTLYQIKNNQLIPHLNIKFKKRGLKSDGSKAVIIAFIYRSSRYVFTRYLHVSMNQSYYFCHDLKSGESYNMKDGFRDDIYTGEKVIIRPFDNDANKFYYLHTHLNEDDFDEPNPTLYIGTFKQ